MNFNYFDRNQRSITLVGNIHREVWHFNDPILCGNNLMNGTGFHAYFIITVEVKQ